VDDHGCYRVDLEFRTHIPVPDTVEHMNDRLSMYLPEGAKIVDSRGEPGGHEAELVVVLSAASPAEALTELARAIEYLSINIRREAGTDALGPMSELRRATITPWPEV
jgi:hypothetical protein